MKISEERRIQKRHNYSGLACTMWTSHDIQVVNISIGGLQLRTNKRLTLEREYAFKLTYGEDAFPLSGIVKWCFLVGSTHTSPGEQVPVYSAGLKVLERNSDRIYRTLHLSDEMCVLSPRNNVLEAAPGTPFVIETLSGEHTAWVQMPLTFRVRTTSSTGMLVETNQAFRAESRIRLNLSINDKLVDIACRVTGQTVDPETGGFLMWLEFITISEDGHCILDCVSVPGGPVRMTGGDIQT